MEPCRTPSLANSLIPTRDVLGRAVSTLGPKALISRRKGPVAVSVSSRLLSALTPCEKMPVFAPFIGHSRDSVKGAV